MAFTTWGRIRSSSTWSMSSAIAPATCGVAKLVPVWFAPFTPMRTAGAEISGLNVPPGGSPWQESA